MKKKVNLVLSLLIIFLLGFALFFYFNSNLCCKYQFCAQVRKACQDKVSKDEFATFITSDAGEKIYLENLQEWSEIEVGTEVKGHVSGVWFFEGVFPVIVKDLEGNQLDILIAEAQSQEWMTDELIPFSFELDLTINEDTDLVLVFAKNNPSDIREYDDSASISISLLHSVPEREIISIYLSPKNAGIEGDCSLVFAVERDILETGDIERATLEELLGGLNAFEEMDYFTNINEGVEIQSFTIENGEAYVDFNKILEEDVSGSCLVIAIRSQIENTLMQFDTIDSITISIDGRTEDILQP